MTLRNVLPLPRFTSPSVIAQLPDFGLICGAVLWILIFLFMFVEQPRTFYGLPIDLRTHEILAGPKSPAEETLSVYLAVGEKYYVNGQEVRQETLRAKLREGLSHRAVWMVYFEGDYDTLNMGAIYAMDVIQSLGAKLLCLTPKVRQQLAQGEKSGTGIGGAPEKAVATSVLRR